MAEPDDDVGRLAACVRRGSVVAAAGCGKTEQIARAVAFCDKRRLILTHTHAGVDALRKRLVSRHIPSDKYEVQTIAGWCLRLATAFPRRSGLSRVEPGSAAQWNDVYVSTARLLKSHAVETILAGSYGGVLVDEYQDCTREQHDVVDALANSLPTCVFGDHMQAIFDFREQRPVRWSEDVFPAFPLAAQLTTPWRWKNAGNEAMSRWLECLRDRLDRDGTVDLTDLPRCISWTSLPTERGLRQKAIISECLKAAHQAETLIVICDGANTNARAALARHLAGRSFSTVEPIGCRDLYDAAEAIERSYGVGRVLAALAFAAKCMTGIRKTSLERAVRSRCGRHPHGAARGGSVLAYATEAALTGSFRAIDSVLAALHGQPNTRVFRKELLFAMQSALQMRSTTDDRTLSEAVWDVQNRMRHAGRRLPRRSIGSTLLVKGLECDRAVVVHANSMSRKDWYVALTRATSGIRVMAPAQTFTPAR